MILKPNEDPGNGSQGLWRAEKCDSKGQWYYVGPFRFSRAGAEADLLAARGKRRSKTEVIDD